MIHGLSKKLTIVLAASALLIGAGLVFGVSQVLDIGRSSADTRVLSDEQYTVSPTGGVLYSADGGQTWNASNLTGWVDVVVDKRTLTDGYALLTRADGLEVFGTVDAGKSWLPLGRLPESAGTIGHSMAIVSTADGVVLLVGTPAGLWKGSPGSGTSWEEVANLSSATAWRVATANQQKAFVQMVYGPNDGAIYSSSNLTDWQLEATGVFDFSSSATGDSIIAISRSDQSRFIFTEQASSSSEIASLSALADGSPVMRVAGDFLGEFQLSQSSGAIRLSEDGGRKLAYRQRGRICQPGRGSVVPGEWGCGGRWLSHRAFSKR